MFITHKDRLARFGTRVLYQILELLNIEIKDRDSPSHAPKKGDSPTNELVNDVLAISVHENAAENIEERATTLVNEYYAHQLTGGTPSTA